MRASVVALITVALALLAHVLGGGDVPRAIVLVPLAAVVLAAAVPFSGRRIGPLGAVVLVGVGQLALHHAFGLLGTMGCEPAAEMVGHSHTVQLACTAAPEHMASSGGAGMFALHVVATLVTALLIAGTDRAMSWISAWLRPLVALLAPVVLPASAPLPVRVETSRAVGRRDVGVVPLRGPPTVIAHLTLAA